MLSKNIPQLLQQQTVFLNQDIPLDPPRSTLIPLWLLFIVFITLVTTSDWA